MTLAEFQDLVLEQGDTLSTWPERQQHEARDLIASSPEVAAILAEAGRLREAILSQNSIKAPAGLKNRIFLSAFASSPERRRVSSATGGDRRGVVKAAAQF